MNEEKKKIERQTEEDIEKEMLKELKTSNKIFGCFTGVLFLGVVVALAMMLIVTFA